MPGLFGGGKNQKVTQTTSNEPWGELQPYLKDYYARSQDVSNQSMAGAYGWSPYSIGARGNLSLATYNPSPLEMAGHSQFQDTIEGDYLYGGPGFDAAYKAAARKIVPNVTSRFAAGGRLNSGLAQTAMTRELSDAFASLYNQERGRQLTAASQYPALQQAQLQRLSVPVSLGESEDALRRQAMFEPQQRLGWLGQQLGMVPAGAGTTNTTSPSQSSMLGNLLGAGYLGTGIWNNLGLASAFGANVPLWSAAQAGTTFAADAIPAALTSVFGF